MAVADQGAEALLIIDVDADEPGLTFRAAVSELASIDANLCLGNSDFSDYAEAVGDDGVFRG